MSVPAGCVGPAVGVPGPPDEVLEWLTAPAPRDRPATSADAASTSDGDSDMMSMIVTLYKSGMVNLTMYWISLFSTVFAKWLSNVEYCCYIPLNKAERHNFLALSSRGKLGAGVQSPVTTLSRRK